MFYAFRVVPGQNVDECHLEQPLFCAGSEQWTDEPTYPDVPLSFETLPGSSYNARLSDLCPQSACMMTLHTPSMDAEGREAMRLCLTHQDVLLASQHKFLENLTREVANMVVQNGADVGPKKSLLSAQQEISGSRDHFTMTGYICSEQQRRFTSTRHNCPTIDPHQQMRRGCVVERTPAVLQSYYSPKILTQSIQKEVVQATVTPVPEEGEFPRPTTFVFEDYFAGNDSELVPLCLEAMD